MIFQNKWNGKLYAVLERNEKGITLECCEDKRVFIISHSEFNFSYRKIEKS